MDSQELGELIFKKTKGNPYFVNQFLHMLHKNRHIRFVQSTETDHDEIVKIGGWMCDTEAIENANYTSNVVDMMVINLRKLPNSIQHLLGAAAIIGNQFEVVLLAMLCHKQKQEIISELTTIIKYTFTHLLCWNIFLTILCREGLVIPASNVELSMDSLSQEEPVRGVLFHVHIYCCISHEFRF
jgi:predicted ATPase